MVGSGAIGIWGRVLGVVGIKMVGSKHMESRGGGVNGC